MKARRSGEICGQDKRLVRRAEWRVCVCEEVGDEEEEEEEL